MAEQMDGQMTEQENLAAAFRVEELDRELIARGAQIKGNDPFTFADTTEMPNRDAIMTQVKAFYKEAATLPVNKNLANISTKTLVAALLHKTEEIRLNGPKGIWGTDKRMDVHRVTDKQLLANANRVAAICLEENIEENIENDVEHDCPDDGKNDPDTTKRGVSQLRVRNYGKSFNLCEGEPFQHQPISAGWLCTGFLVGDDIIATAGHCANEKNVKKLRILFDYKMSPEGKPVTQVANQHIYKGMEIVAGVYSTKENGRDWALIRLDRKVRGRQAVRLSKQHLCYDQPVYVIGHPAGLPLKVAPGAQIREISENWFAANLDIYNGSSGSPVFCADTHDVIGIVIHGDNRDFRWTGNGWISIRYPNPQYQSKAPECARASQLIPFLAGK